MLIKEDESEDGDKNISTSLRSSFVPDRIQNNWLFHMDHKEWKLYRHSFIKNINPNANPTSA